MKKGNLKSQVRIVSFISLLVTLCNMSVYAAIVTSTSNGNFSSTSTWSGGKVPVTGDIVIINHNVILDQNFTIGKNGAGELVINSGKSLKQNAARELTIEKKGGYKLTNYGALEISKINMWGDAPGGIFINNGTATIYSNFSPQKNTQITNNGILNFSGNVLLESGSSLVNEFGGTINLDGTFSVQKGSKVENHGTINSFSSSNQALYLEGGNAELHNYITGIINIPNGGFFNNGKNKIENNSLITVKNFDSYNTGGTFNNNDSFIVTGNMRTGMELKNASGAYIGVGGNFTQLDAYYTDNSGFIEIGGNFDNYASVRGTGGGFIIQGVSTNWWSGTITGTIDICDKSKAISTNFVDVNRNSNSSSIATTSVTACTYTPPTPTPLPVDLISFTAVKQGNEMAMLNFSTAWEINNSGFEVERSTNGISWTKIGFVAGKGNPTEINNYSFPTSLVNINSSVVYYRLRQVDFNGQFEYSATRTLRLNATAAKSANVYPNPATSRISVSLGGVAAGEMAKVTIMDMSGKVLVSANQMVEESNYTLDMNIDNLTKGNYIVNIASPSNNYNTKLVKF